MVEYTNYISKCDVSIINNIYLIKQLAFATIKSKCAWLFCEV